MARVQPLVPGGAQRLALQAARLNEVSQRLPRPQVTATQAYHLAVDVAAALVYQPVGTPLRGVLSSTPRGSLRRFAAQTGAQARGSITRSLLIATLVTVFAVQQLRRTPHTSHIAGW